MTNQVKVFQFNQSEVRTEIKDGEPLFCLADVATILDIKNTQTTDLIKQIEIDGNPSIQSKQRLGTFTCLGKTKLV